MSATLAAASTASRLLTETLIPEGAGAINPSGIGSGVIYMYTGVNDTWFVSQQIAEPDGTNNSFGTALTLRDRRLVVSSDNTYPYASGPFGYVFERGLRESAWVVRAALAGNGLSIDLSGNTVMIDSEGLRFGTFPTVVNLPALREPEVAP